MSSIRLDERGLVVPSLPAHWTKTELAIELLRPTKSGRPSPSWSEKATIVEPLRLDSPPVTATGPVEPLR